MAISEIPTLSSLPGSLWLRTFETSTSVSLMQIIHPPCNETVTGVQTVKNIKKMARQEKILR